MWLCLSDAFFSIVNKDCSPGQLLVRARRPGDIEKVFGRLHKVERDECADYLYRARIPREDIALALAREVNRIVYDNFKDSVADPDLKHAYMTVWSAMASVQPTPPYSGLPSLWSLDKPPAKRRKPRAKAKKASHGFVITKPLRARA